MPCCKGNEPNGRSVSRPPNGHPVPSPPTERPQCGQKGLEVRHVGRASNSRIGLGVGNPACWVASLKPACQQTLAGPPSGRFRYQ